MVQPKKTRPYITERLLMGRKESNQTNKQNTNWEIPYLLYQYVWHNPSECKGMNKTYLMFVEVYFHLPQLFEPALNRPRKGEKIKTGKQ